MLLQKDKLYESSTHEYLIYRREDRYFGDFTYEFETPAGTPFYCKPDQVERHITLANKEIASSE